MADLTDGVRIKAMAEWMFRHPAAGHASIPSAGMELLLSPKREIQDISELRRLLNHESDSNRFFMLSEFAAFFEAHYGESFMAERSRGLLMHGPAATLGQSTCPYRLHDVSYYAYDRILNKLKQLDSPFVTDVLPGLTGKPEAEKVRSLAKWLKENWPGCEGLAIPGEPGARPARISLSHPPGRLPPAERPRPPAESHQAGEQQLPISAPLVAAGLLAILAAAFYFFRHPSRR